MQGTDSNKVTFSAREEKQKEVQNQHMTKDILRICCIIVWLLAFSLSIACLIMFALGKQINHDKSAVTQTFYQKYVNKMDSDPNVHSTGSWIIADPRHNPVNVETFFSCLPTNVCNISDISCATSDRGVNYKKCVLHATPTYNQDTLIHTVWDCAVQSGIATENSYATYSTCTTEHATPILIDSIQDSYSKVQFSQFSGPLFLILGMWIMVRFALTTLLSFQMNQIGSKVTIDKTTKRPMYYYTENEKTSYVTGQTIKTCIALVWDLAILCYVFAISYPTNKDNGIAAGTTQGSIYCVLFIVLDIMYMFCDIIADMYGPVDEQVGSKLGRRAYTTKAKKDVMHIATRGYNITSPVYTYQPISAVYATQTDKPEVEESSNAMYAINGITLTDCWVLCEPLFIVGAVGCLQFARTVDIVQLFWLTIYYTLANACYSRLLYSGYVHDSKEGDSTSWRQTDRSALIQTKNNIALLIRSMTVMVKTAAFFLAICVFVIFFFRYTVTPNLSTVFYFSLQIFMLIVSVALLLWYDMGEKGTHHNFMMIAKAEFLFQFLYKAIVFGVILINTTGAWTDTMNQLNNFQSNVYKM